MMKQQKTYHAELTEDGSGRTLTQEIIRRFRKNRMAVAALCVVALLLLISVGTVVVDLVTGKEGVRVSLNWFIREDEIDRLAEAIARLTGEGL